MKFSDSFRAARWVRLINLLLQAVLFLTLFMGLNYVALYHPWRFDLTSTRRHSLSAETKSYLADLRQDVRIIVTYTDDDRVAEISRAYQELSGLLREYAYATRNNPTGAVTVEFLDVYQNRRRADELGIQAPNLVVLLSGEKDAERRRALLFDDLYTLKDQSTRVTFRGESAITSAILDVISASPRKIYFLQGHGELSPDDTSAQGMSQLADALRARNYELEGLDLNVTRQVPADADSGAIIIAGPRTRIAPQEELQLRNYLQNRAGRIILLVDPKRDYGLKNLVFEWGIVDYDNLIIETDPRGIDELGNLRLFTYVPHAITQIIPDNRLPVVVGPARVVAAEPGRTSDGGLSIQSLAFTSESAWGETAYRNTSVPYQYTPGDDLRGNMPVFTISERIKPAALSVRGGRLAVFGTSDLVTNQRFANLGNLTLFLNTVNWAVEREIQLSIPARTIERFQLSLSREELGRLRLGLVVLVPGAVALLGLLVYWTRRS